MCYSILYDNKDKKRGNNMWGDIAISFMLAFIIAFVVTPYTIKLAKKVGAIDFPKDERRINTKPMPRLGGIAVILGFVVSIIYSMIIMSIEGTINLFESDMYYIKMIGFGIGIFILGLVCYIDDVKGIPPLVKLAAQMMAAITMVICGVKIDNLNIDFINNLAWSDAFYTILTIGWIVGITNAINLIDGLDGLSTGIGVISSISLLIIFALNGSPLISIILITALAGALIGFLPFNFNPAKTFIGDVGSNFLGFSLAVISILRYSKNVYSNCYCSTTDCISFACI